MTQLKQTSIGKIPENWEVAKISYLFTVETGTTPSTRKKEYWHSGTINWFTPTDLSQLNGKVYIDSSTRKITEKAVQDTNLTVMPKGAIVISTRAPVGYVAMLEEEGTFNQGCKGLIPKDFDKTHSLFYCYHLLSLKPALQNLSGGSTFKELSKKTLENLKVPFPPLPEQKAIAQVLSTVDDAIQKVDGIIARTERLKKGLMQKLLTKGIGHKEFKDTEIGRIPKEWKVVKLGDVLELCQYGLSISMSDSGKYPIIRMDEIKNGYVIPEITKCVNLDDKTFQNFKLEKGDILFNRTNAYDLVGRTGIFHLDGDYVFASYLIRLKPHKNKLDSYFLTFYMRFSQERLRQMATRAVHQANINATNLRTFKIPVPPLPEQRQITSILLSIDKKLELERKRKERLERVKKGLMNNLLTGRKRVKVRVG